MNLKTKKILVTGGASFIGSHLVDQLVEMGTARVRIADNLSSGKLKNIKTHIKSKNIEFIKGDLRDSGFCAKAVKNIDVVFHLAADHGGRGYVDLHQAACAVNLQLDGTVFWEARCLFV